MGFIFWPALGVDDDFNNELGFVRYPYAHA